MIWLIGGTKDSRLIAEKLVKSGKEIIVSTATTYGKELIKNLNVEVIDMRLDVSEMISLISAKDIKTVIDASHPYADKVSTKAMLACQTSNIEYIRYERKMLEYQKGIKFNNIKEIVEYINENSRGENILSTLGSKNLNDLLDIKEQANLFIRILPTTASIKYAEDLGYLAKNIIALQGPFSKEFNKAIIKNYSIKYLITKESGVSGGELEKVEACLDEKVNLLILKRPEITYPLVFDEIEELLKYVYEQK